MRAFWAILGVLMLAAAGYLFMSESPGGGPAGTSADTGSERLAMPQAPTPRVVPPAESPSTAPSAGVPDPKPVAPSIRDEPPKAVVERSPATPPAAPTAVEDAPTPVVEPPKPAIPGESPAEETGEGETGAAIVQNEDGSITVDGKFRMRGQGTADDPYQVSWDQLVSAQEDYAPKDGRDEIPARVKMLDGKYVHLVGNIAFPMMMDEAEECLVMLNQWDGCCIGIPPTPYDAVEVKLKHVVTGDDRLTTYGSVTGKMRVDPHLVGGWLVGLYVMEHATLKPQAFGGFSP